MTTLTIMTNDFVERWKERGTKEIEKMKMKKKRKKTKLI